MDRRSFMGRIAGATAALVLGLQAPEPKVEQDLTVEAAARAWADMQKFRVDHEEGIWLAT